MADPLLHFLHRDYIAARSRSELKEILDATLATDVSRWSDDFMGDTLHGGYQSTASGVASVAAAISTGVVNGAILLDAGTADAGRSDLSLGLHFRGDQNPVFLCRAQVSAVTSVKMELGFTDVISGTDAGAVLVKATPTFTASDAAVLCLDTNDDANLTLMGVANNVVATVVDLSTVLAAATYYYFGVALRDGLAKGFLLDASGNLIEETAFQASFITSTVLLTPWLFVQNRSGAQRTMTVDYLLAYQRRTAAQ